MRKGSLGIGFSLLLVSTLFPVSLWAQESAEPSWESLQQLRVGQKVQVVEMNLNTLKGMFLSYSEEAIGPRTAKGDVALQRPESLRVSSREHSKRSRNAQMGALTGVGARVGLGIPFDRYAENELGTPYFKA